MDTTTDPQTTNTQDQVIEGQIEESTSTTPVSDVSPAELLVTLESTIKANITAINTSKNELKKLKEMLADTYENDSTYREHDKLAKEAAKVRAATKSQILKQQAAADIAIKVRDLSTDLKDAQGALSDYLREYQRLSGSNEFTTDDGEVMEIVSVAHLVKRSSRP